MEGYIDYFWYPTQFRSKEDNIIISKRKDQKVFGCFTDESYYKIFYEKSEIEKLPELLQTIVNNHSSSFEITPDFYEFTRQNSEFMELFTDETHHLVNHTKGKGSYQLEFDHENEISFEVLKKSFEVIEELKTKYNGMIWEINGSLKLDVLNVEEIFSNLRKFNNHLKEVFYEIEDTLPKPSAN